MTARDSGAGSALRARAREGHGVSGLAWDHESPGGPEEHTASGIAERAYEMRTASPYLIVEEVAVRLRTSKASVHELTRTGQIPHRRLPGSRRCLFLESELEAWEAGAELDVRDLERGGRIVSVKA